MRWLFVCVGWLLVGGLSFGQGQTQGPVIEVRFAPELLPAATEGRVLVVFGKSANPEPRFTIGDTGMKTPLVVGADGVYGKMVKLTPANVAFPIPLNELAPGKYFVQAVFDHNPDLRIPDAPGNLYSKPFAVMVDPTKAEPIVVSITEKIPDEKLPDDTERVKYLKFPSKVLSDFHKRPMFLRVGILLPKDFAEQPNQRYPLRVSIGGYGTRFTAIGRGRARDEVGPKFVRILLDGCGPYGDPYQVDSANHGPYGTAITTELIPHIEREYRCLGGTARVLDGGSTGGWVSFALQVFYPDLFSGCWSFVPDPVDFRAFEVINIYRDANAYVNKYGFERPAKRDIDGDTVYTVRHECLIERVLGRGDRWELSGKDWCAWNATFGPRGEDGKPVPVWDGKTGAINSKVAEQWRKYDLRHVIESNWAILGPKLAGKVHIYAGEADDYFLNNAVHRLDAFLKRAVPPSKLQIVFGMRQTHDFHPIRESEMLAAMAKACGLQPE